MQPTESWPDRKTNVDLALHFILVDLALQFICVVGCAYIFMRSMPSASSPDSSYSRCPYSNDDCGHGLTERWGAGVETPKNVRGEIGGWGRVPFNETYAPLLSTIYDGA